MGLATLIVLGGEVVLFQRLSFVQTVDCPLLKVPLNLEALYYYSMIMCNVYRDITKVMLRQLVLMEKNYCVSTWISTCRISTSLGCI